MPESLRPHHSELTRLNYRAGFVRLAISGLGMTILPLTSPRAREFVWVLVAYFLAAVAVQILISRNLGGRLRVLAMGVVDLAVYTFFVHLLGTLAPMLVTIYVFIGMLYALVAGLRVAQLLAVTGSAFYGIAVWAEATGRLPYAPAGVDWITGVKPDENQFLSAALSLPVVLFVSVTLVGKLTDQIRERESALRHLKQHDSLTQLANRRQLLERVDVELARVARGHPLVAVLIDLDGFKALNEAQGPERGDELLTDIARGLERATRKVDVVGRYGGDEFLVLLPDTSTEASGVVVDRLVQTVRELGLRYDAKSPVTASVGVVQATDDDDAQSLVRRAGRRAHEAKEAGGDRAVDE